MVYLNIRGQRSILQGKTCYDDESFHCTTDETDQPLDPIPYIVQ